jgi:hypothetical protein
MSLFDMIALVVTVTTALGYLNRQLLGLPMAIGVMVGGATVRASPELDPIFHNTNAF